MKKKEKAAELLTKKDLQEISQKIPAGGLSFSFYLGAKPNHNFVSEANSAISEAVKKIEKGGSYSKNDLKKIEKVSEEIKKRIRLLRLPDGMRSIAIFCDTKKFMRMFHLPVYLPSKFMVEPDFYVRPLALAFEQNPKYLVVVLERDKARFFKIFFGEMEEISEMIVSDVPQKMNEARVDWKGLSEGRIRGHIEDHENRHLKKVCATVEDYFKYEKNGSNHLIIGAHRELINKFAGTLGASSKERLVGSYRIMPNYKLNEIKEKSRKVIMAYEKAAEKKLTEDLFDGSSKKKSSAVLGSGPVLDNFYLHNISSFVLGKDFKEKGFICPECHYVSSYRKICPNRGTKMIEVEDLADEIIEKALAEKIKLKHLICSNKEFDKFGIGAFLRSAT